MGVLAGTHTQYTAALQTKTSNGRTELVCVLGFVLSETHLSRVKMRFLVHQLAPCDPEPPRAIDDSPIEAEEQQLNLVRPTVVLLGRFEAMSLGDCKMRGRLEPYTGEHNRDARVLEARVRGIVCDDPSAVSPFTPPGRDQFTHPPVGLLSNGSVDRDVRHCQGIHCNFVCQRPRITSGAGILSSARRLVHALLGRSYLVILSITNCRHAAHLPASASSDVEQKFSRPAFVASVHVAKPRFSNASYRM